MKKKKILMIFTEWATNEYRKEHNAFGGVGYYRIVKPAQYLEKYFDVDVGDIWMFEKEHFFKTNRDIELARWLNIEIEKMQVKLTPEPNLDHREKLKGIIIELQNERMFKIAQKSQY